MKSAIQTHRAPYEGRASEVRTSDQQQGVVIYGEHGCGKTRHANALAAHYGKTRILDGWRVGMLLPADALALTNDPTNLLGAIQFLDAMHAAGLFTPPANPGPQNPIDREAKELSGKHGLYIRCKGAHDDLVAARLAHGEKSPEYQEKRAMALAWIGSSLTEALECAVNHLILHGHDRPCRTKRTD